MGTDLNPLGYEDTTLGLSLLAVLRTLGMSDEPDDDDDDDDDDDEEEPPASSKGKSTSDDELRRVRAESKKRRLALKDLRKELDDLKAKNKEYEDKGKTDAERFGTENEELRKRLDKLEPALKEATVKLAFFESGKAAAFQNPAHALRLIDVSDIDDDDPEAVAEAISERAEALLKEAPYLKASAAGSGNGGAGDDGEDGGEKPPTTEQGTTSRGKRGKPDSNADLAKRFPALAGRIS